jgi:hypothetical protein
MSKDNFNKEINVMNRDDFNKWLDTCPTDGWRVVSDTYGFIHVAYGIEEDHEWVEESSWSQFKLATLWFLFGVVVSFGVFSMFISFMSWWLN